MDLECAGRFDNYDDVDDDDVDDWWRGSANLCNSRQVTVAVSHLKKFIIIICFLIFN